MQVIHVNPHLGHLNNETGKEKHKPGNTLLSKMQLYAADLDMVSTYFWPYNVSNLCVGKTVSV